MRDSSSIRLPLILAIALHVILFSALFVHLAQPDMRNLQLQPDVDIIKAVAVNPADVAAQLTQIKQQEEKKQREMQQQQEAALKQQEEEKQQEIQRQEALKQQEAQEQQRQKDAAAAAEKAAQEAAQKKAAQETLSKQVEAPTEPRPQGSVASDADAKKESLTSKETSSEKAKKQAEAKKQQEEKVATAEKAKKEEAEKKKAAKKEAEKKAQEKAAQDLKLAQQKELESQIAAEKKEMEAARTAQQQTEIDKYTALILHTMRQNWIVPEDVNPNMSCQLAIKLNADGTVVSVTLLRSSGNAALDNSAKLAVFKSSPLPVPADKELFNKVFKEFNLTVSPKDIQ